MTEFVLRNDYFEFNGKYQKQQYKENVLTYAYMDKFETGFIMV